MVLLNFTYDFYTVYTVSKSENASQNCEPQRARLNPLLKAERKLTTCFRRWSLIGTFAYRIRILKSMYAIRGGNQGISNMSVSGWAAESKWLLYIYMLHCKPHISLLVLYIYTYSPYGCVDRRIKTEISININIYVKKQTAKTCHMYSHRAHIS